MHVLTSLLLCTVYMCTLNVVHANDTEFTQSTSTLLSSSAAPVIVPIENVQKINCTLDEVREFALNYQEKANSDQSSSAKIPKITLELNNCTLPILTNELLAPLDVIQLSVVNSKVSIIGDGWLNGLEYLEILHLAGNRFREFQTWSEDSLDGLLQLHAANNQIWRINVKALSPYPNLQRLDLARNRIETLPDGLFKSTPNLKWLSLEGNMLKRIETYTFKSLLKMDELHLENNRIEYVNPYALATNGRLRELHLQGNRITQIDILLYNLPSLSYLNLSSNLLDSKALETNVFHQNHKLNVLDLSHNRLREFQVGTFNGLNALRVLNISNNELLYIQSMSLSTLEAVTHWDASNNNLTYVMDNQFVYLGSAEYINLSHNKIDNIQKYSFSDLPELKVLDLSYNQIFDDEFFSGLATLQELNLCHNKFDAFDPNYLETIGQVNMRDNPLGCSWLLSEIGDTDFGDIRLGNLVGNQSGVGIKAEEIKCNDYDNDNALGNGPIIRNIIFVRKLVRENATKMEQMKDASVVDVSAVFAFVIVFQIHSYINCFFSLN